MPHSAADVIVVGAGIVGCAVAWELARRGVQVRVIDRRDIAQGATQASAGVLAPFIEGHGGTGLRALGARSLELFDDFVAGAIEASGRRVEYSRSGTLEVARDADAFARLEAAATEHARFGTQCELLDAAATRAAEARLAPEVAGGLLVATHGFVASTDLTFALGRAAMARGATLVTGRPVRRIAAAGSSVTVETETDAFTAAAVVLAAGSWAGRIEVAGAAPVPVRPVRGQLLQLGWSGPPLARVTWGARCYLVPWEDGSLLVGATSEEVGFDERATAAGVGELLDAACELVPHVKQASFKTVRVGLRPAAPDELPIVGASRAVPGLWYAAGHYRNGILLAPLTARLLADALLDRRFDPVLDSLSPARVGLS